MKKLFSVLLSAVLIAGALSGCEGTTQSGGSTAADVNLETKPTLRVLMPYVNFDANNDYTAKYLEQATGYKVNYELLPNEDALVKLNAIISSRDPFDIMVFFRNDFNNTVSHGAYYELNALLDKYGENVKKKTEPGLWTNVTIDGKILGIPEGNPSTSYGLSYRVRTDLLDKAGTTMPTTTDEFYNTLKAIKENLNIIPITSTGSVINEVASAFNIPNVFNLEDGEVVHRGISSKSKDYLKFMNKLYSEGLLDSEWVTNTSDKLKEKFFSGKAAIYRVAWWEEPVATKTYKEKLPEASVDYLPALKDEKGNAVLTMERGTNKVVVIPKVAKNPEHAMNYINAKLEDDVFKELSMGVEGVHYKVIDEKTLEPILPIFFDEKSYAQYYLTGSDTEKYNFFWRQTRVKKDPTLFAEFNKIQDNAAKATIIYDLTSYMTPNKAYTDVVAKVNTFTEDSFLQFITGARSLDEWDAYVAEWKANGGDQLTEVINEWWKSNKETVEPLMIRK